MNKYVRGIAAASALFSVTVAGAQVSSASPSPSHVHKGVTLKIWDYFGTGSAERATEIKIIKRWERLTGNTVQTPVNPNSNTNTKMCQAAPAGQGPDLVGLPHDAMGALVACRVIAPIPSSVWGPKAKKAYIKAGVQADFINGKEYAMPWAIETTGIYYNKALISSNFFKPVKMKVGKHTRMAPIQWSKIIKWARAHSDLAAKKYALGFDPGNFYYDYTFISAGGGYVFKNGYNWHKIGLDTPGAVKGATFMRNLFEFGRYKVVPSTMTYDIAKSMFNAGKLPMFITGPWDEQSFQQNNINYGFAPWPSLGKKVSRPFSGVQVFGVNAFSPHKAQAFSLLKYLTTHLQMAEFHTSGRIPVIKSYLASRAVQKNAVARGLAQAALNAQPMPSIAEMSQVWTPMGNALTLINTNKAQPGPALRAAVQQIQSAIAKAHSG